MWSFRAISSNPSKSEVQVERLYTSQPYLRTFLLSLKLYTCRVSTTTGNLQFMSSPWMYPASSDMVMSQRDLLRTSDPWRCSCHASNSRSFVNLGQVSTHLPPLSSPIQYLLSPLFGPPGTQDNWTSASWRFPYLFVPGHCQCLLSSHVFRPLAGEGQESRLNQGMTYLDVHRV